jgi:hypothetical protein
VPSAENEYEDHSVVGTYEGGSDLLVSSWRAGTERTKVTKHG